MPGTAERWARPTAAPSAPAADSEPEGASRTEAAAVAAPRRPRRQRAASSGGRADVPDAPQLSVWVEVQRMTPEEEAAMFGLLGRLVADRLSRRGR